MTDVVLDAGRSTWTVDTLHVYLLNVIALNDKRHTDQVLALEKVLYAATAAAENESSARLTEVRMSILSLEKAGAAVLAAQEKAITVAQTSVNEAIKSQATEFRMQLASLEKSFHAGVVAAENERNARFMEVRTSIAGLEKMMLAQMAAQSQAVQKAEAAAEKRFENLNEFRSSLSDQQRSLIPRSEATVLFSALNEKIDQLSKNEALRIGAAKGLGDGWKYVVSGIGVLLSILTLGNMIINYAK